MQDFIIKLLDLKEEVLDSIPTVSKISHTDFLITLKVKDHVCSHCEYFTRYVKDYRTRKLKHNVLVKFQPNNILQTKKISLQKLPKIIC